MDKRPVKQMQTTTSNNIDFSKSLHPDDQKARAIERAFSETEIDFEQVSDFTPNRFFTKDLSVIIASYNGVNNLQDSLPALLRARKSYSGGRVEIMLLVNGSTDDTVEVVSGKWPMVKIVEFDEIVGLPTLLNKGVEKALYPAAMILKDDMIVDEDFITPLLQILSIEDVFAVVPAVRLKSRKGFITSINIMEFSRGKLRLKLISDGKFPEPVYLPGLSGSASLFKRDEFLQLGGFDPIYDPAFFYDLDLGYRAWKRGMKVVYCRQSVIDRLDNDILDSYYHEKKWEWLKIRNYLMFVYKNITSPKYYYRHWFDVMKKILAIKLGIDEDQLYLESWNRARIKNWDLSKKRKIEKKESFYTDVDLIKLFSTHPDNRMGIG